MKEIFFALRGENPNTFATAYMTYDGNLLYRNYNELRESKRLHLVDFKCYCYGDEVHPNEISSQINNLCFKAKMKHPELNFFPQFLKRENVDKSLEWLTKMVIMLRAFTALGKMKYSFLALLIKFVKT